MNRLYFSLAALLSSGIFAYAYWKEWIAIQWMGEKAVLLPDSGYAPYFHASEELYLRVLLIFALLFSIIFVASIVFSLKKNHKAVFFCFIFSMLTIFAVMINGAIK
ncbi:hypothetical protein [Cecembia calidifontis]|jgi:hypothetical protein|uniref:Uncharacterized protein n=1 Tax=Cecembia calidifontis TaxID=1187080 RepID=A0A4Q7P980_9BACT|nr:hypothetical protein [Cecembia calidifontis]RZS96128.1 hypothetical protein BC751_1691 [Cecembia calidifontis]